ncbi:MAG: sigma-70 family RNA polymerase sigma factor, partial [Gemmatimonadetes bacterium]|nr:sigma-70 family RNA polymerase sigma factor [Gemmatimonadota bacterium]
EKASQQLEQELGRAPTVEEIADEMGLTESDVRDHQIYALRAVSLDSPTSEEGQTSLVNLLEDEGAMSPDERVAETDLSRDLTDALNGLDPRERKILRDYFGMDTGEGTTLEAIGRELGLTRERVRQLKERGIRKLFLRKDRERLRSYLS